MYCSTYTNIQGSSTYKLIYRGPVYVMLYINMIPVNTVFSYLVVIYYLILEYHYNSRIIVLYHLSVAVVFC